MVLQVLETWMQSGWAVGETTAPVPVSFYTHMGSAQVAKRNRGMTQGAFGPRGGAGRLQRPWRQSLLLPSAVGRAKGTPIRILSARRLGKTNQGRVR